MQIITLLNALKSLFTKKTSGAITSSSFFPALDSQGNVTGMGSAAELANVLGVLPILKDISNLNLDDLRIELYYTTKSQITASIINKPFNASNGDIFVISHVCKEGRAMGFQICCLEADGGGVNNGIYVRYASYYSNSFSEWRKLI